MEKENARASSEGDESTTTATKPSKLRFTLRDHANERLLERSGVLTTEFLAQAQDHAIQARQGHYHGKPSQYWLVWLVPQHQGYVFITRRNEGEIITVLPRLHVDATGYIDGDFVTDERNVRGGGRIKAHSLLEALNAAGAEEANARDLLNAMRALKLRSSQQQQSSMPYKFVVHYFTGEPGLQRHRFKVVAKSDSSNVSSDVTKKAKTIVMADNGWNARLSITRNVQVEGRKQGFEFVNDIELML